MNETPKFAVVRYPAPILRAKTAPVNPRTPGLRRLVEDMFETMYHAEGVGLAANQIGLNKRLAVIDCSGGADPKQRLVLLNPELIATEGEIEEPEGCLSFPGLRASPRRAVFARVRAQDLNGDFFEVEGDGLLGKALQHETDHLNGHYFIDRLSQAQRALVSGALKKLRKAP